MNEKEGMDVNELSALPQGLQGKLRSISTGVKFIMVCVLALVMAIPAIFVNFVIEDRTERAQQVTDEISSHVGGQQTILGPTLAVPYAIPAPSGNGFVRQGVYLVFPAQGSAAIRTVTEERHRSLFKVPVFQADMKLDASFDLAHVPAAAPVGANLDWSRAEIVVGVSDARGALADGLLTLGGQTSPMEPATLSPEIFLGEPGRSQRLTLFAVGAGGVARPDIQLPVSAALRFSGAQRLALLAYGKSTRLALSGDWANPSFDGGFLPVTRSVGQGGFRAEWSVPFIARGVRAEGTSESIRGLGATALGVSFVEVADPYQSVTRSLKYVPLFLGLIFLAYFVFEVTTGRRVHPAQYLLVGVAQIVFYLLLLSIAERLGFDLGFLIGGTATVLLLSINAGWVFASRPEAIKAGAIFVALYGLIYLLLRLEDNALLLGAVTSFLAVAAAMYLTRRTDWYSARGARSAHDA